MPGGNKRAATTSTVGRSNRQGLQNRAVVTEEIVPYAVEIFSPQSLAAPSEISHALERVQNNARRATASSRSLPVLGGVYWPNVVIPGNSTVSIPHGLGLTVAFLAASVRVASGAQPAVLTEAGQSADRNVVNISTTTACTADLWIFPRPTPIGSSTVSGALNNFTPPTSVSPPTVAAGLPGQIYFTNLTPSAQWLYPTTDISSSSTTPGKLQVTQISGMTGSGGSGGIKVINTSGQTVMTLVDDNGFGNGGIWFPGATASSGNRIAVSGPTLLAISVGSAGLVCSVDGVGGNIWNLASNFYLYSIYKAPAGAVGTFLLASDYLTQPTSTSVTNALLMYATPPSTTPAFLGLMAQGIAFNKLLTAVSVGQDATSSANGATLTVQAQGATGASNNGGQLALAGGTSGSATAGTVVLQTAGTTRLTAGATGVITIANLSTGIVHSDASGNLTSSLLVNADVAAAAAIAVSKLAAGTSAQVLLCNATPTPTWTTLTTDVTVSATGVTTVNSISGATPVTVNTGEFRWANGQTPIIDQSPTSTGSGATFTLQAQGATGAAHNGGILVLAGGTSGSATAGTVVLQTGGNTRLTVGATGVITIANLGTGLVHSDASGNLTSSLLVDADVASNAAIAVSKLAAGTAAQVLLNNATPTPTWTTLTTDVTVSATGVTTVNSISGASPIAITPATLQWTSTTANPLLTQAAPASSAGAGTTGSTMAHTAQAGGATTGSATTGGTGATLGINAGAGGSGSGGTNASGGSGGNLALSSGAGGAKSGTGAVGANGNIQFQIAGTTAITVTNSSGELQWASAATALLDQVAPASGSGAGTAGTGFSVTAQAGGATTGSSQTAGAGGALNLTAGAGGSASGGTNSTGGAGASLVLTAGTGGAKSGTGTGGAAGTIVMNIPASVSSGAEGGVYVQRGGTNNLLLGTIAAFAGTYAGLWGMTAATSPTSTNYLLVTDGSTGFMSPSTAISLRIAGAGMQYISASGVQFFSTTTDIGGGSGVIGISAVTTVPTSTPAGGVNYWANSGTPGTLGMMSAGIAFHKLAGAVTLSQDARTTDAVANTMTVQAQGAWTSATTNKVGGTLQLQGGPGKTSPSNGGFVQLVGGSDGTGGNATLQGGPSQDGLGAAASLRCGGAIQGTATTAQILCTFSTIGCNSSSSWGWTSTAVTLSNANVTLSSSQYNNPLVVLSGTMTAAITLTFPNQAGFWLVDLSGLSGYSATNTLSFKSGTTTKTVINVSTALSGTDTLVIVVTNGTNTIYLLGSNVTAI